MKYLDGLRLLYSIYPRQFCTNYRINVNSFSDIIKLANKYNGKKRCYVSILNYSDQTKNNIILDKFVFDLDSLEETNNEPRCLVDARKLHNYLLNQNVKHLMVFSGRGFHIYVFTKNYESIKYPKYVMRLAQTRIIQDTGILVDRHIVGDVARVMSMPGTYNTKRNRFCIFINEHILNMTYSEICLYASINQFTDPVIYGDNYYDLSDLSKKEEEKVEIPPLNVEITSEDAFINSLPPCVQKMLLERGDWKSRWYVTLFLKDVKGLPKDKIDSIAKKYFSRYKRTDGLGTNYDHYVKVKTLEYAFLRNDFFPNCETLWKEGYCPGKCKFYNSFYLKRGD